MCNYGAKRRLKGVSKEITKTKSSDCALQIPFLGSLNAPGEIRSTVDKDELLSSGGVHIDEATFTGMLADVIYEEQSQAEYVLCYVQK
jgi:hypothetical protein